MATQQNIVKNSTNPTTNEGNLLSLITLQQVLGTSGTKSTEIKTIVQGMAKEETRYLIQAMKILTGDFKQQGVEDSVRTGAQKLRDQYGKDMNGAIQLAGVLKTKANKKQYDLVMNPFVMDALRHGTEADQTRQGFRTTSDTAASNVWKMKSAAPKAPISKPSGFTGKPAQTLKLK